MAETIDASYDGVRFAPVINKRRPFQILGFTEDWRGSVDDYLVIFMDLKQAQDLYNSLGVMLNNTDQKWLESNV